MAIALSGSLILSGSITVSGSIISTGTISMSGSIASASYATNADLLDGLDSTVFTLTSSFNAQTASFTAFTSSINSFSASILATTASLNLFSSSVLTFTGSAATRLGALEAATASLYTTTSSLNSFSASVLTFTGSAATRLGALEAATSSLYSYTSSLNNKTSSFATTGSNAFIGTQTITGSVLQSGSFTSTGTLTAQTLVVQTITSSVVYSSGSNIFGNTIGNTQTFTGSVLITGSLTISTGGNVSAPTIFGSTIACSPIGCFATSCATSFIGGTMSGTTIYGSTAVCSPVGKFSTCIDAGSGTFSGALSGTIATFAVSSGDNLILEKPTGAYLSFKNGATLRGSINGNNGTDGLNLNYGASHTTALAISSTGAATFSSTITGTTLYGSTTVCSPVGYFSGCVGIGTASPSYKLEIYRGSSGVVLNLQGVDAYDAETGILFTSSRAKISGFLNSGGGTPGSSLRFYTMPDGGSVTERLRINSDGIACFSSKVCAPSLTVGGTIITTVSPGAYEAGINYLGTTYSFGSGEIVDSVDFKICGASASTAGNRFGFWTQAGNVTPVERLRIDKNGISCFACQVCAPSFRGGSFNGTNYTTITNQATIPSSCTSTILTLSSSAVGVYIVQGNFGGQGNTAYGSTLIVVANSGAFRIVTNGSASNSCLTLSGANVQIQNVLGISLDAYASAILIGN